MHSVVNLRSAGPLCTQTLQCPLSRCPIALVRYRVSGLKNVLFLFNQVPKVCFWWLHRSTFFKIVFYDTVVFDPTHCITLSSVYCKSHKMLSWQVWHPLQLFRWSPALTPPSPGLRLHSRGRNLASGIPDTCPSSLLGTPPLSSLPYCSPEPETTPLPQLHFCPNVLSPPKWFMIFYFFFKYEKKNPTKTVGDVFSFVAFTLLLFLGLLL